MKIARGSSPHSGSSRGASAPHATSLRDPQNPRIPAIWWPGSSDVSPGARLAQSGCGMPGWHLVRGEGRLELVGELGFADAPAIWRAMGDATAGLGPPRDATPGAQRVEGQRVEGQRVEGQRVEGQRVEGEARGVEPVPALVI